MRFSSNLRMITTFFIIIMAASTLISTPPVTIIQPLEIGLAAKLPIFFWAGLLTLGFLFYINKESKLVYRSTPRIHLYALNEHCFILFY